MMEEIPIHYHPFHVQFGGTVCRMNVKTITSINWSVVMVITFSVYETIGINLILIEKLMSELTDLWLTVGCHFWLEINLRLTQIHISEIIDVFQVLRCHVLHPSLHHSLVIRCGSIRG